MTTETIPTLDDLLAASQAGDAFKAAVRKLADGGQSNGQVGDEITFNRTAPAVKALRTIYQLLDKERDLPVEKVLLQGHAGCSDFVGEISAVAGGETHTFAFNWDCKWRADQEGWRDAFGFSDQARAARTFGYQCFKEWRKTS